MLNKDEIKSIFNSFSLENKNIVLHSSYKNLPNIFGGIEVLIEALIESFDTIMVPTFSYKNVAKYYEKYPPKRNGCDYSFYNNWSNPVIPFNPNDGQIDKKMGIVAELISKHPLSKRSNTPWHSWAVIGKYKDELLSENSWLDTDLPLKKLIALDGYCLLLGVNFSSCSAIHIAEELTGRKNFIRWAYDEKGHSKRVEAQGCGEGFQNLYPYLKEKTIHSFFGEIPIFAIKLKDVVNIAKEVIAADPEITRCSDSCIKCRDMIAGGPIE